MGGFTAKVGIFGQFLFILKLRAMVYRIFWGRRSRACGIACVRIADADRKGGMVPSAAAFSITYPPGFFHPKAFFPFGGEKPYFKKPSDLRHLVRSRCGCSTAWKSMVGCCWVVAGSSRVAGKTNSHTVYWWFVGDDLAVLVLSLGVK